MTSSLRRIIEAAWENGTPNPADLDLAHVTAAVEEAIDGLDSGRYRVAEPGSDDCWSVNQWLKKAVLLSFRLHSSRLIDRGGARWWDKIPSKFDAWRDEDFNRAGFRAVPPCAVRRGAYIGKSVVLMPSFVNIGAYVGDGTMVDSWATIGSCAQIGRNVHVSGGVGIGGVLEPLQARPVIVEDDCFIGARSELAEGIIVRRGAVIAMGVFLSGSTRIVERRTGRVGYGEIPPYSVVVPGCLPAADGGPSLACAVIVKQVDARTRAKTAITALLRDDERGH